MASVVWDSTIAGVNSASRVQGQSQCTSFEARRLKAVSSQRRWSGRSQPFLRHCLLRSQVSPPFVVLAIRSEATTPEPKQATAPATAPDLVPLGASGLRVPRLGVGTLQWGDTAQGFGERFKEQDLREAFQCLTSAGLQFFDTAEVYGYQGIKAGVSAEQLLGKFEKEEGGEAQAVIATKFFTIPWTNFLVGGGFRLGKQSLMEALRASLVRLGRKQVDLYQIHFPFPTFSNAALMEALSEAVGEGLASAVGVSNYSVQEMEEAHALLSKRGIPLASNQVRYSVVSRRPETDGLLDKCRELDVALVAYSPLASGLISEKNRRNPTSAAAQKVKPLLDVLHRIGEEKGGRDVSQVALAYLVHRGAIPIPACKSREQAERHIHTLQISLTDSEVEELQEKAASLGF